MFSIQKITYLVYSLFLITFDSSKFTVPSTRYEDGETTTGLSFDVSRTNSLANL